MRLTPRERHHSGGERERHKSVRHNTFTSEASIPITLIRSKHRPREFPAGYGILWAHRTRGPAQGSHSARRACARGVRRSMYIRHLVAEIAPRRRAHPLNVLILDRGWSRRVQRAKIRFPAGEPRAENSVVPENTGHPGCGMARPLAGRGREERCTKGLVAQRVLPGKRAA